MYKNRPRPLISASFFQDQSKACFVSKENSESKQGTRPKVSLVFDVKLANPARKRIDGGFRKYHFRKSHNTHLPKPLAYLKIILVIIREIQHHPRLLPLGIWDYPVIQPYNGLLLHHILINERQGL